MILEQTWFLKQGIFPLIKNMKYNNILIIRDDCMIGTATT